MPNHQSLQFSLPLNHFVQFCIGIMYISNSNGACMKRALEINVKRMVTQCKFICLCIYAEHWTYIVHTNGWTHYNVQYSVVHSNRRFLWCIVSFDWRYNKKKENEMGINKRELDIGKWKKKYCCRYIQHWALDIWYLGIGPVCGCITQWECRKNG